MNFDVRLIQGAAGALAPGGLYTPLAGARLPISAAAYHCCRAYSHQCLAFRQSAASPLAKTSRHARRPLWGDTGASSGTPKPPSLTSPAAGTPSRHVPQMAQKSPAAEKRPAAARTAARTAGAPLPAMASTPPPEGGRADQSTALCPPAPGRPGYRGPTATGAPAGRPPRCTSW